MQTALNSFLGYEFPMNSQGNKKSKEDATVLMVKVYRPIDGVGPCNPLCGFALSNEPKRATVELGYSVTEGTGEICMLYPKIRYKRGK